MGDVEQSGVLLGHQLQHQFQDQPRVLVVQVPRGLIRQDQPRTLQESPADGDPLHLSAAQVADRIIGAIGQADPFQQLQHPRFEVTSSPVGDQCRESHVLPDRQVGQEMEELEDESDLVPAQQGPVAVRIAGQVLSQNLDSTMGRKVDARGQMKEGGLAAATSAHDGDAASGRHLEGDVVKRRQARSGGFLIGLRDV